MTLLLELKIMNCGRGLQPLKSAAGCRRHFSARCKVKMKDVEIHNKTCGFSQDKKPLCFSKDNTECPRFIIGLLHDMGKVVLYQFFGEFL